MWKSAFAIFIACMMSGAALAQDIIMPAPQKIDSMTRNCVYNSAFYSQGAVICLGGGRGLQCRTAVGSALRISVPARTNSPHRPRGKLLDTPALPPPGHATMAAASIRSPCGPAMARYPT
jgi:hypothetical protein